ncbi:ATP-binding cassette domain-containing protein [Gordonia sp. SID5947]|uniref:ABC transporter ATP-binding protein n=1 Tax=Gordonia sp. SID5947 TaxID=2690315 RepID=UPI0013701858|nr:ABC transporter ATP-binding protein [Gordonia sp. SID5947]MYR06657.1 ATP-binding cassette domain-containing protein [Gordonia sp. SID5947]
MTTPRVALRGVTRQFADGTGVRRISLNLSAGEIVALVGLNGAGKTTLMRVLLGMLSPDAGTVELGGVPIGHVPSAAWRTVGHLVEYPLAYGELTARQNLVLSARLHRAPVDVVDRVMAEFALGPYADKRTRKLSLGNRQRLGLASALQHDPTVIVLDEPTNSLDPSGVITLRDALRCRAANGSAVLVSSHHLDEVARIADRIEVLNDGRLIGGLDPGADELERVFFEQVRADDERRHR